MAESPLANPKIPKALARSAFGAVSATSMEKIPCVAPRCT